MARTYRLLGSGHRGSADPLKTGDMGLTSMATSATGQDRGRRSCHSPTDAQVPLPSPRYAVVGQGSEPSEHEGSLRRYS
jgi:hypothetical protein